LLSPDDFDQFICRYIIKGTLKNLTQLHIGTGNSDTEFTIDNPFIRIKINGNDIPYIPGSTLKGIFRTEIERYFKGLQKDICYPYDHNSRCNTGEIEEICLACQIFGCQQLSSHFLISDAVLIRNKDYKGPGIKIKTGIAINRITGSTQRGALYQFETLQPGGVFSFEFQIINIDLKKDGEKAKAILYLLKNLKNGWIQVGGKKSTGLGQIAINKTNDKYDCIVTEIRLNEKGELESKDMDLEELLGEN